MTDGTTNDAIVFHFLVGDIDAQLGVARADKGYLSNDNVQYIEYKGAIPNIRPNSCST